MTTAGDSDYLVINQSGTDKKITRAKLGVTGTGVIDPAGFTLTVPATGTAALIQQSSTSLVLTLASAGGGTPNGTIVVKTGVKIRQHSEGIITYEE